MNGWTLTGVVLIAVGAALLVIGTLLLRIWHVGVENKARRKGRKQR